MIVSQYAITENYARKIPTILTYSLQETHEEVMYAGGTLTVIGGR